MVKVINCKNRPENPVVFKHECPVYLRQIKTNDHCLKCPFNPSQTVTKKKIIKSKSSILRRKNGRPEIITREPWRNEAICILTNPIIRFFLDTSEEQDSEMLHKIRNPYLPYFFKFSQIKFNEDREKYKKDLTPLLKALEKAIKQGIDDTDKHFQKIEKIVGPASIDNVRELMTKEAEYFLALREQWRERSRGSGIKKQIKNVEKLSKHLFDGLSKLDDDARLALSRILGDIDLIDSENLKNPVFRIRVASIVALKEISPDKGGSKNPWKVIAQRNWFHGIRDIWEKATGKKIQRDWRDEKGACGDYKKVTHFFQLLWQPLNPEEEITISKIDGKIKDYL